MFLINYTAKIFTSFRPLTKLQNSIKLLIPIFSVLIHADYSHAQLGRYDTGQIYAVFGPMSTGGEMTLDFSVVTSLVRTQYYAAYLVPLTNVSITFYPVEPYIHGNPVRGFTLLGGDNCQAVDDRGAKCFIGNIAGGGVVNRKIRYKLDRNIYLNNQYTKNGQVKMFVHITSDTQSRITVGDLTGNGIAPNHFAFLNYPIVKLNLDAPAQQPAPAPAPVAPPVAPPAPIAPPETPPAPPIVKLRAKVLPYVDCVLPAGDKKYMAFFGYDNPNDYDVLGSQVTASLKNTSKNSSAAYTGPDLYLPGRYQALSSAIIEEGSYKFGLVTKYGMDPVTKVFSETPVEVDFSTATAKQCAPVTPLVECLSEAGNNKYKVNFSYDNQNSFKIFVPESALNDFSDASVDIITDFEPGRHVNAFSVEVDKLDFALEWRLLGKKAVADLSLKACNAAPVDASPSACGSEKACACLGCESKDISGNKKIYEESFKEGMSVARDALKTLQSYERSGRKSVFVKSVNRVLKGVEEDLAEFLPLLEDRNLSCSSKKYCREVSLKEYSEDLGDLAEELKDSSLRVIRKLKAVATTAEASKKIKEVRKAALSAYGYSLEIIATMPATKSVCDSTDESVVCEAKV